MTINAAGAPWYTPYQPFGMRLTYVSTTTMTVGAGNTPDSTFQNIITLASDITISLAASGAGGIDAGTVAASTKYYVYAIGSSNSPPAQPGAVDNVDQVPTNPYPGSALLSTSAMPSLPFGYDMYRYIGTIYTDGSSHINIFWQTGYGGTRTMFYDSGISVLSAGTSTTYANINLSTAVPRPGLEVIVTTSLTPNSSSSVTNLAPYGSTSTSGIAPIKGQVAAVVNSVVSRLPCASNAGVPYILYKTTSGSDSVAMVVTGYVDQF